MPPYTSFSFAGTVSLPVDTAATQGDGKHHASYDGIFPFTVKWRYFLDLRTVRLTNTKSITISGQGGQMGGVLPWRRRRRS